MIDFQVKLFRNNGSTSFRASRAKITNFAFASHVIRWRDAHDAMKSKSGPSILGPKISKLLNWIYHSFNIHKFVYDMKVDFQCREDRTTSFVLVRTHQVRILFSR